MKFTNWLKEKEQLAQESSTDTGDVASFAQRLGTKTEAPKDTQCKNCGTWLHRTGGSPFCDKRCETNFKSKPARY